MERRDQVMGGGEGWGISTWRQIEKDYFSNANVAHS